MDLALNNLKYWYAIKLKQPTNNQTLYIDIKYMICKHIL